MVAAIKVRIPDGRGRVITTARDTNMAVQISQEIRESNTENSERI